MALRGGRDCAQSSCATGGERWRPHLVRGAASARRRCKDGGRGRGREGLYLGGEECIFRERAQIASAALAATGSLVLFRPSDRTQNCPGPTSGQGPVRLRRWDICDLAMECRGEGGPRKHLVAAPPRSAKGERLLG